MTPGPGAGRSAEFLSLDLISIVTSHPKSHMASLGRAQNGTRMEGAGSLFSHMSPCAFSIS